MIYTYDPDREAERQALRPRHLQYMSALRDKGRLSLAGAWIDEPNAPGALLVLNTDDPLEALDWLKEDPNQLEHIVTSIETHRWTPAVGTLQ